MKINEKPAALNCSIANDFFSRFFGLMGRKSLPVQEAIVFPNCNSIHTFFMRFPIDVVMVGKDGKVVEVIEAMRGWRMLLPRRSAKHTVEMNAMRAKELGIHLGDELRWD